MARAWNWQTWGRSTDLIHKSDLNGIVGKFACLEQFRRKKEERATGGRQHENASGKLASGNAVHAVLHRILCSSAAEAMRDPSQSFSRHTLATAFDQEFERERAGRTVDWYRANADKWRAECVSMLEGLLADMHNHVGEVVLVEAGFVYQLDGIWVTGSTDLIYRAPGSERLSLADWKTGAQRPHQIDLDHGFEAGIYGNAIHSGYFVPYANVTPHGRESRRDAMERVCTEIAAAWQGWLDADERQEMIPGTPDSREILENVIDLHGARTLGEYPERIRHVHLRDYIPYARAGSKMLSRPEELEWAGLSEPEKMKYVKGDLRGPAWYRVQRSESDTPRLIHLLRSVVSWVRFGRFPPAPGELCSRCVFREACLLDGYKPVGEDKKQLERAARQYGFDGFDFDDGV